MSKAFFFFKVFPSLLLFFLNGLSAQHNSYKSVQNFTVEGFIKNCKNGQVTLGYYDFEKSRAVYLDTSDIVNGKFNFKGMIKGAVKVVLSYNNIESNMFFIDKGHNSIKGIFNNINDEPIIQFDSLTSKSNLDAYRKKEFANKIYLERGKILFDHYNRLDSILNDSIKVGFD